MMRRPTMKERRTTCRQRGRLRTPAPLHRHESQHQASDRPSFDPSRSQGSPRRRGRRLELDKSTSSSDRPTLFRRSRAQQLGTTEATPLPQPPTIGEPPIGARPPYLPPPRLHLRQAGAARPLLAIRTLARAVGRLEELHCEAVGAALDRQGELGRSKCLQREAEDVEALQTSRATVVEDEVMGSIEDQQVEEDLQLVEHLRLVEHPQLVVRASTDHRGATRRQDLRLSHQFPPKRPPLLLLLLLLPAVGESDRPLVPQTPMLEAMDLQQALRTVARRAGMQRRRRRLSVDGMCRRVRQSKL